MQSHDPAHTDYVTVVDLDIDDEDTAKGQQWWAKRKARLDRQQSPPRPPARVTVTDVPLPFFSDSILARWPRTKQLPHAVRRAALYLRAYGYAHGARVCTYLDALVSRRIRLH